MTRGFEYKGTGGELFVKFFVGILLCLITLGIYYPWFIVSLTKYNYEKTRCQTENGHIKFTFTGDGATLFGTYLIGAILTVITFGIYGSWFMVSLMKYFWTNSSGESPDGKKYRLQFNGNGAELFGILFVGYLLTIITLGIYGAWFFCKINAYIAKNSAILDEAEQKVGSIEFKEDGAALLGTWLVGIFLTIITFGIYSPWFTVKLLEFFTSHTRINVEHQTYTLGFQGKGVDLLVINIVGWLLTVVTFGIYGAWYFCNQQKFYTDNLTYREAT